VDLSVIGMGPLTRFVDIEVLLSPTAEVAEGSARTIATQLRDRAIRSEGNVRGWERRTSMFHEGAEGPQVDELQVHDEVLPGHEDLGGLSPSATHRFFARRSLRR
jgi:hypothetical protein